MDLTPLLKNKKIHLAILVLVGAIGLVFFLNPRRKAAMPKTVLPPAVTPLIEISSLSGVVSRVDDSNNVVFVQHPVEQKEVRVVLNDQTEIFKVEFPFDPKNPPRDIAFTPRLEKIALAALQPGSHILVETDENIYQKDEFDTVKRIEVLP